jgi:hypothetical protein
VRASGTILNAFSTRFDANLQNAVGVADGVCVDACVDVTSLSRPRRVSRSLALSVSLRERV